MELRQYFSIIRKWLWLVLLTTMLATAAGYLYSLRITPLYRAQTTILLGRTLEDAQALDSLGSRSNALQSTTDLAQVYALLATQPQILEATAEEVRWPGNWQSLFFKVVARSPGNQMLTISVTDDDPVMAQSLANEVTRQLILQGPIGTQRSATEGQRAFLSSQLQELQNQIESAQKSLTTLSNQAALESDPLKLADLNSRAAALQSRISDSQKNYASLSLLLSSGSNLFVTVLAAAQVPSVPISPNITQNVLFAALAGLVLSGGAILLFEYLDDSIKSADDTQRILDLSTLATIVHIPKVKKPLDNLITLKHPRSPISEAYRVLRTNLRSAGLETSSTTLLVTSGSPREGKTTTAANLGVIFAQSGQRVILLDSDLRRPSLHKVFDLPNQVGLGSLFLDETTPLQTVLQSTPIAGLRVMTSGPVPPNPAEALDSKRMGEILSALQTQCDIVVLDSPPVLAVADGSILSAHSAGAILVVDANHTRADACRLAVEALNKTKTKLYGVVLNNLKLGRTQGYGYYHYYYSYASSNGSNHNGHHPDATEKSKRQAVRRD